MVTLKIHMIRSFPPSLLNRGENNEPKTIEFGNTLRSFISSQCINSSIRKDFNSTGIRTRTPDQLFIPYFLKYGEDQAKKIAFGCIKYLTGKLGEKWIDKETSKLSSLIYINQENVIKLAPILESIAKNKSLCEKLILLSNKKNKLKANKPKSGDDDVDDENETTGDENENENENETTANKKKSKPKNQKKSEKTSESEIVFENDENALLDHIFTLVTGVPSADMLFFGRMVAQDPMLNIDGCLYTSHILGTHPITLCDEFFTAIDDLSPKGGAAMMDTNKITSSCYYQNHVLDLDSLKEKTRGIEDFDLKQIVEKLLHSIITSNPVAKQHSMYAKTYPSLIFIEKSNENIGNKSNAFEKQIVPDDNGGYEVSSIISLIERWNYEALISDLNDDPSLQLFVWGANSNVESILDQLVDERFKDKMQFIKSKKEFCQLITSNL